MQSVALGAGLAGAIGGFVVLSLMQGAADGAQNATIVGAVAGGISGIATSLLLLSAGQKKEVIERIKSIQGVVKPLAKYSHVAKVNNSAKNIFYISGQTGHAIDGSLVGDSIEEQADLCFSNIKATLIQLGLTINDLVKITVYLTSRDDLSTYRSARDRAFGDIEPASTLIITELVDPDMCIEIEAIAAK